MAKFEITKPGHGSWSLGQYVNTPIVETIEADAVTVGVAGELEVRATLSASPDGIQPGGERLVGAIAQGYWTSWREIPGA